MKTLKNTILSISILVFCTAAASYAQNVAEGYVLYDDGNTVHLLNNDKEDVHTWEDLETNPYGVYLKDNGNLIRPCQKGDESITWGPTFGYVQEIDSSGNIVWEFSYTGNSHVGHHDIAPMPNGNFLMIAYEQKSAQEAQQAGIDDSEILVERILEVEPPENGNGEPTVVWEWHIWDHLTTGNEPELFNVDKGGPDESDWGGFGTNEWMHMNGIDYNAELDQIMFSSRYFSEFYIIDHSTTTQEAAGHTGGNSGKGGDILFRWGNPENYGAGGEAWVSGALHCPMWVPSGYPGEGNITVFVNESKNGGSEVVEVSPTMDGEYNYVIDEPDPVWTHSGLSADNMSGCNRLSNGNTFICEANSSRLSEVTQQGNVVWEHSVDNGGGGGFGGGGALTPRAIKYGKDHPGIQKLLGFTSVNKGLSQQKSRVSSPEVRVEGSVVRVDNFAGEGRMEIFSVSGKRVMSCDISNTGSSIDLSSLGSGMYIAKLHTGKGVIEQELSIIR